MKLMAEHIDVQRGMLNLIIKTYTVKLVAYRLKILSLLMVAVMVKKMHFCSLVVRKENRRVYFFQLIRTYIF